MKTLLLSDVCPTDATWEYYKKCDIEALFADTVSLFENKDFAVANLECAITDTEGKIEKHGPCLNAPVETAEVLKKLGVDAVSLSNNHFFDFGETGARDTIKALEAAGVKYTGFGENYEDSRRNFVFEKLGERVCVIAVCEHEYSYALEDACGARPFDEFETLEDIREAKKTCDTVIVLYHGGKEHCRYPSPRLYRACRAMARAGADVVLCQHTHCVSCYEEYEGCHILYGQGNFNFVWKHVSPTWFTSLAVTYDTVTKKIEFIPLVLTDTGCALAHGEAKEEIMSDFASRNKELENGEWRRGWHEFCVEMCETYENNMASFGEKRDEWSRHLVGHLIDCEAHQDVVRELFPTYHSEKNIVK